MVFSIWVSLHLAITAKSAREILQYPSSVLMTMPASGDFYFFIVTPRMIAMTFDGFSAIVQVLGNRPGGDISHVLL